MALLDKAVSKNAAGTWDFQCPGPVDSPCGPIGGPGFSSTGWPTKKAAVARGQQHFHEHASGEPAQPMDEFMADQGLTTTPDGTVIRVEDLA